MTDSRTKTRGDTTADAPLAPDVIAADELFDVLSDQRRRYVLQCLGERETSMVLADLADEVAKREHGSPLSDISEEAIDRIRLSLYHSKIPKLAASNLVEYCEERELVSLSPENEHVEALLELATARE